MKIKYKSTEKKSNNRTLTAIEINGLWAFLLDLSVDSKINYQSALSYVLHGHHYMYHGHMCHSKVKLRCSKKDAMLDMKEKISKLKMGEKKKMKLMLLLDEFKGESGAMKLYEADLLDHI